ncbi:MAG: helix-turn-helix domain-containing protein [Kineosporiaceae bacterium]|nr:helix-turn-helix domain-containing protein [Kineosporiaceae bacterium]MBK8076394.1 helix-turn-helix domain-containing protein [Kineosporiaceae bacterium]
MTEPKAQAQTQAQTQPLAVRARMYAALGEPVRLQIVDHLTYGDASPGELGAVTGLATNLLAFHLSTLEDAGLIRRVRSEGDGRRSYVQLRWDDATVATVVGAATTANPLAGQPVPRVLFVCTHNSARSQLAAASWSTMSEIPVASAGTHPAEQVHPKALDVARRHGLQVVRPSTHQVDQTLQPGDLVVAVCDNAHEELTATPPQLTLTTPSGAVGRGWLHWAIPDPVSDGSDASFETAYADISHRVARLAQAVTGA